MFCSYTVLRKDVREINCDFPPKADAGLRPGEWTFETAAPAHISSLCVYPNCSPAEVQHGGLRQKKLFFPLWNAAAVDSCHY